MAFSHLHRTSANKSFSLNQIYQIPESRAAHTIDICPNTQNPSCSLVAQIRTHRHQMCDAFGTTSCKSPILIFNHIRLIHSFSFKMFAWNDIQTTCFLYETPQMICPNWSKPCRLTKYEITVDYHLSPTVPRSRTNGIPVQVSLHLAPQFNFAHLFVCPFRWMVSALKK